MTAAMSTRAHAHAFVSQRSLDGEASALLFGAYGAILSIPPIVRQPIISTASPTHTEKNEYMPTISPAVR